MRKGGILFCVFLIAVAAYAIFASIGWSFKAKLFPLSIGIPLLLLATAQLLLILFGKEETNEGGAMDVEFSTDVEPEIVRRRVLGIFGWIIAFIAFVYLLGFPITVPLFIFLYLKFQSEVSWLWTTVITSFTWGCFHMLFQSLVHIQFEAGAIQSWLGR
ncbi:MAG: tripartite tricarboxylate transporter TctB family protein [Candidatus Binatia bacterium]